MSRRMRGLLVGLVLLVVVALTAFKIQGMLRRGEPVFWLAELWAPAAFLSIGVVTCIEYFLPPSRPAQGTAGTSGQARPAVKRRKGHK